MGYEGGRECQYIAARELAGDNGTYLLVNHNLLMFLEKADDLCMSAGGMLISRQAVACLILQWQAANPDKVAYRDKDHPTPV